MAEHTSQPNLSPKQQAFVAAFVGPAKHVASEAARLAGYKNPYHNAHRLMENDGIKAAIDEHLAELKRQGIALKQNRLDAYDDRWQRLKQVLAERGADPSVASIPGGTTGLIVKQLKRVHHRYEPDPDDPKGKPVAVTEELWEAAVDTGLLKELRDLEKQAAIECGDWTEKSEVTSAGALRLELAGMRVPLPTSMDDE